MNANAAVMRALISICASYERAASRVPIGEIAVE